MQRCVEGNGCYSERNGCIITRIDHMINALCYVQLNFTEKGLRKMMEMSKSYRQSLGCEEVLDTFKVRSDRHFLQEPPQEFLQLHQASILSSMHESLCGLQEMTGCICVAQAIFAKARKLQKQTPELKADLEAFESKLDAEAAEVVEEEAAATAARSHAVGGRPAESVDATEPMDAMDSAERMDAEARVEDTGSAAQPGEVGAPEGQAARHEDSSQASAVAADSLLGGVADSAHSAAAPLTQTPDEEGRLDLRMAPHTMCRLFGGFHWDI